MFLKTPKIKSRITEIAKALYRNFSFLIKDGFPKKHSKEIKFHIINKRNTTGLWENAPAKSNLNIERNILVVPQPGHKNPVVVR